MIQKKTKILKWEMGGEEWKQLQNKKKKKKSIDKVWWENIAKSELNKKKKKSYRGN